MWLPDNLDATVALALLFCSLLASLITAGLGAGGGVFLLVMMATWIAPAAVIPVHGLIQLGSSTGRATMTWRYIRWSVIAVFLPGAVLGAILGALLLVRLPAPLWQSLIALFILYLCWGPRLPRIALGAFGTLTAAALTTFASLFVGATGPLVAAFVRQLDRDRFATVATFSVAMILQHASKVVVFGASGFSFLQWLPFIAAMIAAGLLGSWLGVRLLHRLDNRRFEQVFNLLLTALALRLIWKSVSPLLL